MTTADPSPGAGGPIGPQRPGDFNASYAGTPPWDIGRPQPAFVALAEAGLVQGRVLDVGCGTGEHVLMAAERGLDATGIDSAPLAIDRARRKASERNLTARFLVGDATDLPAGVGEQFDTVLDCGLFHVFSDDDRRRFVAGLTRVIPSGGRYFMLGFSDRQPGTVGPRRLSREEIRESFTEGWRVDSIDPATIDVTDGRPRILAWLSALTRR